MSPAPKCCPQEQESKILLAAAQCIEESSLLDFTMAGVARHAGMSMGSIYKHIHSKEDVLVALATESFNQLYRVFSQIFRAPELTGPERLIAISLLDFTKVDAYPFTRHLEMMVGSDALVKRASLGWVSKKNAADRGIEALFLEFLNGLHRSDELYPEGEVQVYLEQLQLAIWSCNVGHIQVVLQTSARHDNEVAASLPFPLAQDNPHILNAQRLINSFHWREPLTAAGISKAVQFLETQEFR